MPLYEYQCECGRKYEELQASDAPRNRKCVCGGLAERTISVFSVGNSSSGNGNGLYQHLSEQTPGSIYMSLSQEQKEELREFSKRNGDAIIGLGTMKTPSGVPIARFATPISDQEARSLIEQSKKREAARYN